MRRRTARRRPFAVRDPRSDRRQGSLRRVDAPRPPLGRRQSAGAGHRDTPHPRHGVGGRPDPLRRPERHPEFERHRHDDLVPDEHGADRPIHLPVGRSLPQDRLHHVRPDRALRRTELPGRIARRPAGRRRRCFGSPSRDRRHPLPDRRGHLRRRRRRAAPACTVRTGRQTNGRSGFLTISATRPLRKGGSGNENLPKNRRT